MVRDSLWCMWLNAGALIEASSVGRQAMVRTKRCITDERQGENAQTDGADPTLNVRDKADDARYRHLIPISR